MTRMRKNMMSKLYLCKYYLSSFMTRGAPLIMGWHGGLVAKWKKVSFVYFSSDTLLLYLSFHTGDSRVSMCTITLLEKPEKREGRAQLPWAGNPSRGSFLKGRNFEAFPTFPFPYPNYLNLIHYLLLNWLTNQSTAVRLHDRLTDERTDQRTRHQVSSPSVRWMIDCLIAGL